MRRRGELEARAVSSRWEPLAALSRWRVDNIHYGDAESDEMILGW